MESIQATEVRRISNIKFTQIVTEWKLPEKLAVTPVNAIEVVDIEPPRSAFPLQINFDHDDLASIGTQRKVN